MAWFRFWYCILRFRFINALACLGKEPEPKHDVVLWACYRTGLYRTVAAAAFKGRGWRGQYARIVSLAACGRTDEAAELAISVADHFPDKKVIRLAGDLAPFAPALALQLLDRNKSPLALTVALLNVNGHKGDAGQLAKQALEQPGVCNPELHLLLSNAEPGNPLKQLLSLNNYLGSYGLPLLSLINEALPPGPLNLKPVDQLPPSHGPLVSILMTTFNCEERVNSAIGSLLAQTWQNLELIVVDDASDDNTTSIVERFAAQDSRVTLIRLPVNVGTYVAKSIGFHKAVGEFVICHDADDWSHPLKIEMQVKPLLNDPSLVYTRADWVRMQDDGEYYARPVHPLKRINPSSPMFRRLKVLREIGIWDPVRTGADSEFMARLRLHYGRKGMGRVALPLTIGSHRPGSLTTAFDTGHSIGSGMSPVRLTYWESWRRWHIEEIHKGKMPVMDDKLDAQRKFTAPDDITVDVSAIRQCLASV